MNADLNPTNKPKGEEPSGRTSKPDTNAIDALFAEFDQPGSKIPGPYDNPTPSPTRPTVTIINQSEIEDSIVIDYLINKIDVDELWQNALRIAGVTSPGFQPTIIVGGSTVADANDFSGEVTRQAIDFSHEPISPKGHRITSMTFRPGDTMSLNWSMIFPDSNYGKKVIIHEYFHLLSGSRPENKLISEAIAEVGSLLFFLEKNDPKPTTFALTPKGIDLRTGDELKGVNMGDIAFCYAQPFDRLSRLWGAATFYSALKGQTISEKISGFQKIVALCPPIFEDDRQRLVPTTQNWLNCLAQQGLNGFVHNLDKSGNLSMLPEGTHLLWTPFIQTLEGKNPWGVITSFTYQQNPNFLKSQEANPIFQSFDLSYGTLDGHTLCVRFLDRETQFAKFEGDQGVSDINPQSIVSQLMRNGAGEYFEPLMSYLKRPFQIQVLDEANIPYDIPGDFYFNEDDIALAVATFNEYAKA